jgi:hypothetical protein
VRSLAGQVSLVLVEFGQSRERAALELLVPTLQRVFSGMSLCVVVVDNAVDGEADAAIGDACHRVSGCNRLREFSGWDRGLAWLDARYGRVPESIVVLANDTVARAEKRERVRDLPVRRVAAAASGGALVGLVEEYPHEVQLFGLRLRQFVDTSLVIAARCTLDALGPLARPTTDDDVFADNWHQFFRDPSPLSDNYRAYLRTYFFGERADPEFDHRWYAYEPIGEHNFEAFKAKMRCVFCEHLLSARARARGIPLVDIRPQPL